MLKRFIRLQGAGFACAVCLLCMASCSVSYKFNGASIDYTKVHTIQIADFPIRATYVWGPMLRCSTTS